MRLLMFGASGQLANSFMTLAAPRGHEIAALDRGAADLADPEAVAAAVDAAGEIEAILNAAAYTAVDKAESEAGLATVVNGVSPGAMAAAAARRRIPLVHVSTDYVFDGEKHGAYREDDAPAPINAYGASKLAGERAVRAANPRHLIVRTSWVHSAHGHNFVKTMLRLGAGHDELRIVDDQWGRPTSADDLAAGLLTMLERAAGADREGRDLWGTYHLAGGGEPTNWAGFAKAIFAAADYSVRVGGKSTAKHPTPARRPKNSVLECGKARAILGVQLRDWRDGLTDIIEALAQAGS